MASIMKSSSISARTSVVRRSSSVRPLRASPEDKPVIQAGAQVNAAPAQPTTPSPPPMPAVAASPSLSGVMAFSGAAPEITNGRLAMLGFVSAVGAELSSGESVLSQVSDQPALIGVTFALFMAASLVPLLKGSKGEKMGPFTPAAELTNGRFAMIGFAALLAYEAVKGQALF